MCACFCHSLYRSFTIRDNGENYELPVNPLASIGKIPLSFIVFYHNLYRNYFYYLHAFATAGIGVLPLKAKAKPNENSKLLANPLASISKIPL